MHNIWNLLKLNLGIFLNVLKLKSVDWQVQFIFCKKKVKVSYLKNGSGFLVRMESLRKCITRKYVFLSNEFISNFGVTVHSDWNPMNLLFNVDMLLLSAANRRSEIAQSEARLWMLRSWGHRALTTDDNGNAAYTALHDYLNVYNLWTEIASTFITPARGKLLSTSFLSYYCSIPIVKHIREKVGGGVGPINIAPTKSNQDKLRVESEILLHNTSGIPHKRLDFSQDSIHHTTLQETL